MRISDCNSDVGSSALLFAGFPAGIPRLPLNLTLLKSCDVAGVFWGAFVAREPDRNRANIARLFQLWEQGKIKPRVTETFTLADGGKAIAKLGDRSAVGRLGEIGRAARRERMGQHVETHVGP